MNNYDDLLIECGCNIRKYNGIKILYINNNDVKIPKEQYDKFYANGFRLICQETFNTKYFGFEINTEVLGQHVFHYIRPDGIAELVIIKNDLDLNKFIRKLKMVDILKIKTT
jgi:hypothetical protein